MRKTKPMLLGDLWGDFLNSNPGVARKINEAKAAELWPVITGPAVASLTESVSVRNGILTAKITSSAARSEIFLRRAELRDAINRRLGDEVLREVIVK